MVWLVRWGHIDALSIKRTCRRKVTAQKRVRPNVPSRPQLTHSRTVRCLENLGWALASLAPLTTPTPALSLLPVNKVLQAVNSNPPLGQPLTQSRLQPLAAIQSDGPPARHHEEHARLVDPAELRLQSIPRLAGDVREVPLEVRVVEGVLEAVEPEDDALVSVEDESILAHQVALHIGVEVPQRPHEV